jgi:hypothetical protein
MVDYALACIGLLESVEKALLRTVEHRKPQMHDFLKAEEKPQGRFEHC